ncbi:MAG: hypothetical protein EA397_03795 [Deltaproteobacteria bacterium]|nr:MAG: hypothetical protein EA397_03795 [Deltaproteobacteria bacterium]
MSSLRARQGCVYPGAVMLFTMMEAAARRPGFFVRQGRHPPLLVKRAPLISLASIQKHGFEPERSRDRPSAGHAVGSRPRRSILIAPETPMEE